MNARRGAAGAKGGTRPLAPPVTRDHPRARSACSELPGTPACRTTTNRDVKHVKSIRGCPEAVWMRPKPPAQEVVVKGRNVEVPDHFRAYVAEKPRSARTLRPDHLHVRRRTRPRAQPPPAERAASTSRSPPAGADRWSVAKPAPIASTPHSNRRSPNWKPGCACKDRRKIHYGDKTPVSLHEATAVVPHLFEPDAVATPAQIDAVDDHEPGPDRPRQEHPATPMTVDEALYGWNSSATTSSCSTTREPTGPRWCTAGTPGSTTG